MKFYAISIMSVNPLNGKLLVSEWSYKKLLIIDDVHHVHSESGLQEITVSKEISDALWSHNGNIIYTEPGSVFVMLPNGTIISTINMTSPTLLSLSNDGGIYLAEKTSVYASSDNGMSWRHVFNISDGYVCVQVIKLIHDHTDEYWTLEYDNISHNYIRLNLYVLDRNNTKHSDVRQRDVSQPSKNNQSILLNSRDRLSYDSKNNIFLTHYITRSVFVWRATPDGPLDAREIANVTLDPFRLAVDDKQHLLYVGQYGGLLSIFNLKYEAP